MKKVTELVAELAAPAVAEQGCTLWDVEYVRDAGQWYLRLYLDKDGGVDILDCEAVSRKVSDLLDQADPIEGSYTFEVSSAGAERPLKRPSDFERFLGSPVLVKTYKPKDGRKEFAGVLAGYDNGAVLLDMGGAHGTAALGQAPEQDKQQFLLTQHRLAAHAQAQIGPGAQLQATVQYLPKQPAEQGALVVQDFR